MTGHRLGDMRDQAEAEQRNRDGEHAVAQREDPTSVIRVLAVVGRRYWGAVGHRRAPDGALIVTATQRRGRRVMQAASCSSVLLRGATASISRWRLLLPTA